MLRLGMTHTLYILILVAAYAMLAAFFPEYIARALFLIPIVITVIMGYVGGWREGVTASVLSLFTAAALLVSGIVPPNDFVWRIVSFLVIVTGINYTQYLRDQFGEALQTVSTQDKRLAIISNSLSDVLITINDKSIITLVNPAVEATFGWTPQELIGQKLTILMPEHLREKHLKGFNKYLSTGKRAIDWKGIEVLGLKKDGTEFPIEISFGEFNDGKIRHFSAIIRDITLRKELDAKMGELASIVESSDDAIISKDLEGTIRTWNYGAQKLFGYTPEEIIGKSILVLFPEGYEAEEKRILKLMKDGRQLDHYETIRKHKDGRFIDVSLTVSPVFDGSGRVVAISKIARDITQQKTYQRELKKSTERYKTFIENSEAAIWLVEYRHPIDTSLPVSKQIDLMFAEGYTAEANQKTADLYGKENIADFIGKSTMMLSPRTTQADEFLKMFIKQNYSVIDYETSSEKDGQLRYGSVTFKGIVEEGKLVRAWVVLRETTERRLQEQEVEKGRQRYQTFIETSEEGIWRVEFKEPISTSLPDREQIEHFFNEGYIAEANEATAKVLNIDMKSSLINKPLHQVAPRTTFDGKFLKLFLENGYVANNYESFDTIKGQVFYYSTTMRGIIEEGKWIRTWMVRRDVTAQKEHSIERERLLKQAEEAKKELEVAAAEKDRFLANLSHELRTPLVSILGYSAMLMETDPDGEAAKKMIKTINKNAQLQVNLIEDLLDLSRIISGKIELKKDVFNLTDLCNDSIDTFAKQAADKGLTITNKCQDCTFYGDKKRLNQLLLNLISNAVKFTDKGEVTVCIKCSDDFLTIKVRDTGIGIDPKNFVHLFKPFKQIDSSSTRSKQGLGLGLSIVKNIAQLHGGRVSVQSKLGEGSEFSVYLPVVEAVVMKEEQGKVAEPTATFEGVKILVVEDDDDTAGFVKYLYEQRGAKVDTAMSCKKARECIAKNKYDLYIFDLSMPEEDGISLIRSVRAAGDNTKAVALTAFADTFYEKQALEAGFDMFLRKPSSLSDLLSVIKLIR